MADTCIVCLGDLAGAEQNVRGSEDASSTATLAQLDGLSPNSNSSHPRHEDPANQHLQGQLDVIAHLLPCGHDLHNECLKPWVQRCNSCPICRQNFNVVELKGDIYGPCLDSYAVQDKRQVADIDPGMIIDDDVFEEPAIEPCILCEGSDDEDVLLLCDGCNGSQHTYCAGLESVPAGSWFCQFCTDEGLADATRSRIRRPRTRISRRRTGVSRGDRSPDAWSRIWSQVWDRLNLDLDFPFDEDQEIQQRTHEQRRDIEEWRRRFRVAERQGGAARFRDTAATLLDGRGRGRGRSQNPESQEELRAWNAFDKARELGSGVVPSNSRRNKRKSPTSSPPDAQPPEYPERTLKRPRTRRLPDAATAFTIAEPSAAIVNPSHTRAANGLPNNAAAPADAKSFFRSLLKEVETSPSTPDGTWSRDTCTISGAGATDAPSPSASSSGSPALSGYSSPRSRSPSPRHVRASRPQSPTPLASQIEPIFPSRRPVSHPRVAGASYIRNEDIFQLQSSSPQKHIECSSKPQIHENTADPPDSSPEQVRSHKADIQALVSAALIPVYQNCEIDKEQYTNINREISRRLYDKIGEDGGLSSELAREKWQTTAALEVDVALKRLRNTPA